MCFTDKKENILGARSNYWPLPMDYLPLFMVLLSWTLFSYTGFILKLETGIGKFPGKET